MRLIARVLKDICTIANDHDYCHSKTLSLAAFVAFVIFSAFALYHGDKFDPFVWAGGAGTIIAAGAAGAKLKETTEPS